MLDDLKQIESNENNDRRILPQPENVVLSQQAQFLVICYNNYINYNVLIIVILFNGLTV